MNPKISKFAVRSRFRSLVFGVASAVLLFGTVSPAHALQPPSIDLGQGGWWMGLGYLRFERPYVGTDQWNRIVPLFNIETGRFFVHGLTLGWRAWQNGPSTISLVARPDALHYNAATNSALEGMTTKLASEMGGAVWTWQFDRHLSFATEALGDLLRRNDGLLVSAFIDGRWRAGPWFFQPQLGLEWQSANYIDYYYGVSVAEARADRPAYTGKATFNEALGFNISRTIGRHFAAALGAYDTHYGSGITGSPIVARATTLSLLFALYYRF